MGTHCWKWAESKPGRSLEDAEYLEGRVSQPLSVWARSLDGVSSVEYTYVLVSADKVSECA